MRATCQFRSAQIGRNFRIKHDVVTLHFGLRFGRDHKSNLFAVEHDFVYHHAFVAITGKTEFGQLMSILQFQTLCHQAVARLLECRRNSALFTCFLITDFDSLRVPSTTMTDADVGSQVCTIRQSHFHLRRNVHTA